MQRVSLFALMCCCFLGGDALHLLRPRPRPLDSGETWNNLRVMTKHAQSDDRDHETRLIPVVSNDMLKNVLHADGTYPRMRSVRSDLHRVARDLEPHCKNAEFLEHSHVKKFTGNYKKASDLYGDVTKARNKAVGETDILFHYLYESCTQ